MHELKIENIAQLRSQMVRAWSLVNEGIKGGKLVVEIKRWSKSRDQEKKYHAMIRDISNQITFDFGVVQETGTITRLFGRQKAKKYSQDVWKALLIEQFAREKESMGEPLRHPGETVTSLDGQRVITVRPSSRQFTVAEARDFIEYLYAQGCEMNVGWSEPALRAYNEYREAA